MAGVVDDVLENGIVEHDRETKAAQTPQALSSLSGKTRAELVAIAQDMKLPVTEDKRERALVRMIRAEQQRREGLRDPGDAIVGFGEHANKTYKEVFQDRKYCFGVMKTYHEDKAGASKALRDLAAYIQRLVVEGDEPSPEMRTVMVRDATHHGETSFAKSNLDEAAEQNEQCQDLGKDSQSLRAFDGDDHKCIALDEVDVPQITNNTTLDQAGKNLL